MGEAIEQLSGKLGLDTTDFKTGIAAANRELRVLESGFRASAASLGDWTKSADGLEMRIKNLTQQIDLQKSKVNALREEYERVKAEKGENSKAAKDLEIKLNKEVETLGKMEAELRQSEDALSDLKSSSQEAGEEIEEIGNKAESVNAILSELWTGVQAGLVTLAAAAAAVAAVSAALGRLVFSSASAGSEIGVLSDVTGISTTRLQELAYVGEQVGTSQDTIVSSLTKLTRSMYSAQQQQADYLAAQADAIAKGKKFDGQLGDTAAAFERLGVSVTDASGNLRDRQEVFNDLLTALGNIQNPVERDALAMSLFGKSAMELNPLIKAGSEEIARLSQEAHDMGAVMSEDTVVALRAFDDTLSGLKAGLKGTLGTLAVAFLPGFQEIFGQLGGYLQKFSSIVSGSGGNLGQIAEGLAGLVGEIVSDLATQAPQMLQAGLGILQSIIDAIVTNLPMMIPAAISMITSLLDFIVANLPTIIDAGLQILIALVSGISQALPSLIPAVVQAVITIVQTLANNLPMLIDAALQLILALAQGMVIARPILIAALPQIIFTILDALVNALPMIFDSAGQLVGMMAYGLVASIPVLLVAAGELIVSLARVLADYWLKMPELGRDFVRGLANGIKSATGWLYDAITDMINGMIQRIKDLLHMHSPSGVGLDIGNNLVGSIGLGGEDAAQGVQRKLTGMVSRLTESLQDIAAPAFGGMQPAFAMAGGSTISVGNIYVDARGAANPERVGQTVQDSVLRALRSKGVA